MASSVSLGLAAAALSTGSAVTTTSSVTSDDAACYVLFVTARHATTAFSNPDTTTVSGMGLTWVRAAEVFQNSSQELLVGFYGYGTPSDGALTITLSQAPSSGEHALLEVRDARRASSPAGNSWTASGTGTTATVTITSPAGGAPLIAANSHATNEVVTPDSTGVTWTEVHDAGTTSIRLETQTALCGGDLSHTATWATSSRWMAIVLELDSYSYWGATTIPDDDTLMVGADNRLVGVIEDDEEGPTVAGKPSGMWAVLGGGVS